MPSKPCGQGFGGEASKTMIQDHSEGAVIAVETSYRSEPEAFTKENQHQSVSSVTRVTLIADLIEYPR